MDEIGDMTPLTQTKVLRVLQDQQFERVGGTEMVQTNVRLIAATNRNLTEMLGKGTFRSDLYYRLNVYTIRVPRTRWRVAFAHRIRGVPNPADEIRHTINGILLFIPITTD